MTFTTFLFVAVVWMSNGSPQPPVARVEVSLEACVADAQAFTAQAEAINAANSPAMRMSFYMACRLVMNSSEAKPS